MKFWCFGVAVILAKSRRLSLGQQ